MITAQEKRDFLILPFNNRRIRNSYLVSNFLGGWAFLDEEEFKLLHSLRVQKGSTLFNKLHDHELLVDEKNLSSALQHFRQLNANLFSDTSLHIAVVTTRCNLKCIYCQTSENRKAGEDMSLEVAQRVLKSLYETRSSCVTLEFQGGEPLLHWSAIEFFARSIRMTKSPNKDVRITLVSNLLLLDEAKARFLIDHNVDICASLDGPSKIHDRNRYGNEKRGTFGEVQKKLKMLKTKFHKRVRLLPTITRFSLPYYKEIIDEYLAYGETGIALRALGRLGAAAEQWDTIGYTADEFMKFWKNALDYILELNKQGKPVYERMAMYILEKIINKRDPAFTEFMNPCGAGRGQIVYMPNGDVYPCDEARMVPEDLFRLGNILRDESKDILKNDTLVYLLEMSSMHLWEYNSVFGPWVGTCPIWNYAEQGNMVPKIHCSFLHRIYSAQFEYIFEKLMANTQESEILKRWVKKQGEKHE